MFRYFAALHLGLWTVLVLVPVLSTRAADQILFNRDVRPILSDNCFQCHGPDERQRKADLRLDMREVALAGGAIVAGDPDSSELVARIFSDDAAERMPPADSHKKLTAQQKQLLKQWIEQGAEYQGHWAYEQPHRPDIPPGVNAIEYLVEQRLKEEGLALAPEADRRTLIRRLHFDLIGLPPTPEEVEAFVEDQSPEAYAQLVERLLASPHYGERMAIGWLDVVRFADTIGYHSDNPRNVWPYRDYVIRSFNENKPFDQFTIEQLAGDLLPGSTVEQKVASCFNHLLLTTEEGGAQPKDYEARMLADRVRAVGTVWLGQTIGCAQCHDHKFDPTTQRDFYSLGAFFADVQEPIIGKRDPGMFLASPEQNERMEQLRAPVSELEAQVKALESKKDEEQAKALEELKKRLEEARKELTQFEETVPRCMVTVSSPNPRTVRILPRGNWMDESGPIVQPALPAYLVRSTEHWQQNASASTEQAASAGDEETRLTRLDLAQWLVSSENPLTARVFVNRLWKQFFGVGLSKTVDDLGSQGEWPAYLELLDWLACEFQESGWDMKHIVRTIVLSRVYRQSAVAPPKLEQLDPNNRLLARQSRFRIEAELVRDTALSASGLLVPKIGGPSVKPYQPEDYWENLNFPPRQYEHSLAEDQYRRGVYTWWQRSFLHPSLLAFDAPSREECAADRSRSNIPQQALVLLNDPSYVEAARSLAARVISETGADAGQRLKRIWQLVLQRDPRQDERQMALDLLEKHRTYYSEHPAEAQRLLEVGLAPVSQELDKIELAAWTGVARTVLNLHETITRN